MKSIKRRLKKALRVWFQLILIALYFALMLIPPIILTVHFGFAWYVALFTLLWISFLISLLMVEE